MTDLSSYKLLAVLLLFLLPPASQGEIYKWVDDKGKVHFGDRPPDKEAAQSVDIKTTPQSTNPTDNISNASPSQQQEVLLDIFEKKRQKKKQQEKQQKSQQQELASYCRKARNELKKYQDGYVLYELDHNGNKVYLDSKQRDTNKQEIEGFVTKNCK